jgi:hypothetical protein
LNARAEVWLTPISVEAWLSSGLPDKGKVEAAGIGVIIAVRRGDFAVFLFGYAKSAQDNLDDRQVDVLRAIAINWLSADTAMIRKALQQGVLVEVLR